MNKVKFDLFQTSFSRMNKLYRKEVLLYISFKSLNVSDIFNEAYGYIMFVSCNCFNHIFLDYLGLLNGESR